MRHQDNRVRLRSLAAAAARAGALAIVASSPALAQSATKTVPVFANGQAEVVPGFQDRTQWIRQELWVETEFDSDSNGTRDRVHVDVTRPAQTETEGLRVPVIYESSPYFAGVAGGELEFWNMQHEIGAVPPSRKTPPSIPFRAQRSSISTSLVATWVPRGFAVVHSESPGTGLSQGCPTVGGINESLAPKAVIDWLNGRARGFTTIDGNEEVTAKWSTGKVGMTGTSYNGTLALAAATTGVDGLEAVIPVAPVSSWYEYYRSYGLIRNPGGYRGEDMDVLYDFINSGQPERRVYCDSTFRNGELLKKQDRLSGDYNDFWVGRDYLAKIGNIKAAVLMAHGFNDWNVMPDQSARIYEALKQRKVPAQAFYHQGGHGGNPPMEQMNRWFTRYLHGVQNDVEKEPRAWIVRETGGSSKPTSYPDYPNPAAAPVVLRPRAGGAGVGGLGIKAVTGQGREKLTDNASVSGTDLARAERSEHRLLYATPALAESVHLSGWTQITTRLASSKPAVNLSVWLVALPDSAAPNGKPTLITRGWADPQNHASLTRGEPLVPGQFYTVTFKLQPDDQVIPAGQRLALMIFASDLEFTLSPQPGTELTIDVDATSITLPVVDGSAAFGRALGSAGP